MAETPKPSRLAQRREKDSRADLWKIWVPLAALVALGFVAAFTTLDPPAPTTFRLAAGAPGGAYHAFAERYRELLAEQGYELEIVETAGAVENLKLLAAGEVPLALVQGGTAASLEDSATGSLRSLASLFYEPVWVFYRREQTTDGGELEHIRELAGGRIAIGAPDSGTRALVLPLLSANGIDARGADLRELPSLDAAGALESGEIDAAFFVASVEAPYVARLLAHPDVQLLAILRSRAYRAAHSYLSRVTLGEGVVDLALNLPDREVPMIATTAALVASAELHHALTPLLLDVAKQVHGRAGVFAEMGTFPSAGFVEFPLDREAAHYLENGPSFLYRILPYRTAATVDRLKILLLPFITLLIPIFRLAPPIYRWRIRSKIYRWYRDLRWVDEKIDELRAGLVPEDRRSDGTTGDPLKELEGSMRELEDEVHGVSVPLSYMDEYYRLREHLALIQDRLERQSRLSTK